MSWQDILVDKTGEFLKEFGIDFAKFYGLTLLKKVKRDLSKNGAKNRRLIYRSSVAKNNNKGGAADALMTSGWLYVKVGEGVSSFDSWKKLFVTLSDGKLEAYKTEKDKKPTFIVSLPGYKLKVDVNRHFKESARLMANDLEMEAPEVSYSRFTWALTHPLRENYIFQMHKGVDAGCACFGGGNVVEPEDAGHEFEGDREKWIQFMESALGGGSPRDLENDVIAITFDRVVQSMSTKFPELKGFWDDGTEGEILSHMLYVAVVEASVKEDLLNSVKSVPEFARMKAWYKFRGIASMILSKAITIAWDAIQKVAVDLNEKIEPTLRSGIEPILEKKQEIQKAIGDKIGDLVGPALSKFVSPFLQPLMKIFESPLRDGLKFIEAIFKEKATQIIGPQKSMTPEVKKSMDLVSKDLEIIKALAKFLDKLVEPLEQLKSKSGDVFEGLNTSALRGSAEAMLRETLDACFFTLQQKMDPPPPPPPAAASAGATTTPPPAPTPIPFDKALQEVLADLRYDGRIQVAEWNKKTISSNIVGAFRRNVDPLVEPVISSIENVIPDALKEILDIRAEYGDFVDIFIGEPINKIVESTFPPT